MIEPQQGQFLGLDPQGFHAVRYLDWRAPSGASGRTAICVHGLTRNSRDFDFLAEVLVANDTPITRVICPDIAGRGKSDWLGDPNAYGYPQYLADMTALIARLDVEAVDWVGTSMGGLIGMSLAALPKSPIRRLVLNDIGPVISKASLQRISDYVGLDYRFSSTEALEKHLRKIHAPFGPLTDAQWQHMALHSQRQIDGGNLGLAYDPAIAENVKRAIAGVHIWSLWDQITCPVLVLHGADSDILSAETAQEMTERGPKAELITFAGVGHAPALMARDQVDIVTEWLSKTA
ncbi:MAG TPA: alpha/beta hydrolase [Dongiaceae bacterium]|nr:alpha/beta hydrolase [Dongiaceae bacterium]